MNLKGNVVLVTGGAKRVGRAIALELARAGCDVAVHYRNSPKQAEEVVNQIVSMGQKAAAIPGDLNASADWPKVIDQTIDQLGRLDVLINNAAAFTADGEEFAPECWEETLRTNLIAPMALAEHSRRHLAAHGQGAIVNLCDISGERPWPGHLAYCCSKAALAALTKGLARKYAPSIRVNGVAPGIAEFSDAYDEDLRQTLVDRVPLGRAGTPGELAKVVRFLVESAEYVTGEIISVDGGRNLV